MRSLLIILGTAGVLAAAPGAQAAYSDDFSTSQTSSSFDGSAGFSTGTTLMTPDGVKRTISAEITSNTAPGDARARTAIDNGAFTFSSDNEVVGFGIVAYSFSTPISLTLTPAFEFTVLSNDLLGSLTISESDSSGTSTVTTVPLPVVAAGAPLVFTVPANSVGLNVASISKLSFTFGGTQGEDLSIDSITAVPAAVPEPGSLALLGLAAGAGILMRRRRA